MFVWQLPDVDHVAAAAPKSVTPVMERESYSSSSISKSNGITYSLIILTLCTLSKCEVSHSESYFLDNFRSTEKDDYVVQDSSGLRLEKLVKVSGKELFRDAQIMVGTDVQTVKDKRKNNDV